MSIHKSNFSHFQVHMLLVSLFLLFATVGWSQNAQNNPADESEPQGEASNEVPDDAQSVAEGRTLFGQHCTVCHAVGKQIIGPALASVHNRRPIDWLVSFIQNSQHVIINEEDEYAQHLYEQYDRQVMPNFEFLSRGEILNILAYIKVESSSTTAGVSSVTESQAEMAREAADESVTDAAIASEPAGGVSTLTIVLVAIILVLMVTIIILAARNRTKTNA